MMEIDLFVKGYYKQYKNIIIVGINDYYVSFQTESRDFETIDKTEFMLHFKPEEVKK